MFTHAYSAGMIILAITIVQMKLQKKWVYSENGGDDK